LYDELTHAEELRPRLRRQVLIGELPEHAEDLRPSFSPDSELLASFKVLVLDGEKLEQRQPLLSQRLDDRSLPPLDYRGLAPGDEIKHVCEFLVPLLSRKHFPLWLLFRLFVAREREKQETRIRAKRHARFESESQAAPLLFSL